MSTPRTPFVHRRSYTDYENNLGGVRLLNRWDYLLTSVGSQWLWPSGWANIWATAIGILVTISVARLVRIVVRIFERRTGQKIDTRTLESIAWTNFINAVQDMVPGPIRLNTSSSPSSTYRVNLINVLRQVAVALVLFGVFAATMAAGVATSFLITSGTALSQHPDCGQYIANSSTEMGKLNITRPYETAAQIESASWAMTYFDDKIRRVAGSLIIPGSIAIQRRNATCPFTDDMCYGGAVQPIELTTGPVSASAFGIHAPKTLEIKRTSTCSPLNMNRTYIDLLSQKGKDYTFGYYYGRTSPLDNMTYQTVRHGDIGDDPVYQVGAFWSNGSINPDAAWIPLPELMPPPGSTVSILFITSQKIYHLGQSLDPTFPALDETMVSDYPQTFWINLSGPGTVLACMDRIEWRDPTTSTVWSPYTDIPPQLDKSNTQVAGAVALLQSALIQSNIYRTVSCRLGASLNAQSRIFGFFSLPLAPDQWKVEVEELFKASVARVLINVRDIARGAQARYWGYSKLPDPDWFCRDTYKMSTEGWSSVAVGWSLAILICALIIVFLAIPISEERLLCEKLFELTLEFVGWIWKRVLRPLGKILVRFCNSATDYLSKLFR